MPMNWKDVVRALKAEGFYEDRHTKHLVMRHADGRWAPIPVHGKKDIAFGTLRSIAKMTKVDLK